MCRACGGDRLELFLSLGAQPLANSFLSGPAEFASEQFYALDVYFCRSCTLVQLLDVVDPEVLFRNYLYVTGTSETMASHNAGYAATVAGLLQLGPKDLVVEAASNDGSLLAQFKKLGVRTLGVEPARNLAEAARASGVETLDRFFDESEAVGVRESHGPAKAVIANNVLAHVDDTVGFLRGAAGLLAEDGLAVFEVPYLVELLNRLEYDTIYHEHLCYFSVMALGRLCKEAGLGIRRIDRVPVHGGSLRVYAGRNSLEHCPEALEMMAQERGAGLDSVQTYELFAEKVEQHRRKLRTFLCDRRSAGRTLAAYGAPAKGNTLLNYCGIDASIVPFTVDRNPLKVGLFTPGMHLPVRPVSALLEDQPDEVLILAWNFASEIMRQQEVYRARGGGFLTPLPEPQVHGPLPPHPTQAAAAGEPDNLAEPGAAPGAVPGAER
ncbi:MAG: class I SAM-dependent methyltransferase [Bryobacterales bacterium]|nr:class I SAM-dependent methyltransferase [Bryobacterales bacterium]MBV9398758.1 class I SAM-dependent methyltransferase [Bryobacterales bacterium]